MPHSNKVVVSGCLTSDPEQIKRPSGKSGVGFGIDIVRTYRSNRGETRNDTCHIDILLVGNQGSWAMSNCKIGSSVVVEGYLSLEKLELPDGSRRNMHEVVSENVLLLQVSGDEEVGVFNNQADFEDGDEF
jgi:single-strand DNA-binding protein